MPAIKGKSPFDFNKSLRAHANDPVDHKQDFARLPGGINGGVAQLTSLAFGKYKPDTSYAGEEYFRAEARVVEPETATEIVKVFRNGKVEIVSTREVRVLGRVTSIIIPCCDTKNSKGDVTSADENVATVLNELKLIGGEDFLDGLQSKEDLEARMAELVASSPYIRFSTNTPDPTAAYPEPRTFERWYGAVDDYSLRTVGSVSDSTPSANGAGGVQAESDAQTDLGDVDLEGVDLDELAQAADADDQDSRDKLTALAEEAGIGEDDLRAVDDWAGVADLIRASKDESAEEGAAAVPDSQTPQKGMVLDFRPIDKKGMKAKKPIEVEVKSVDARKETASLLNLDDKKTVYKDVKWADLIFPK